MAGGQEPAGHHHGDCDCHGDSDDQVQVTVTQPPPRPARPGPARRAIRIMIMIHLNTESESRVTGKGPGDSERSDCQGPRRQPFRATVTWKDQAAAGAVRSHESQASPAAAARTNRYLSISARHQKRMKLHGVS